MEARPLDGLAGIERVDLLDRGVRGIVGYCLLVVVDCDVLTGVVEHDGLLGHVERVAVGCLGLIDLVGAEVELRRCGLALLIGDECCYDLALMRPDGALGGLDGLGRYHQVG